MLHCVNKEPSVSDFVLTILCTSLKEHLSININLHLQSKGNKQETKTLSSRLDYRQIIEFTFIILIFLN